MKSAGLVIYPEFYEQLVGLPVLTPSALQGRGTPETKRNEIADRPTSECRFRLGVLIGFIEAGVSSPVPRPGAAFRS